MRYDLLIKNGDLVLGTGVRKMDLGIKDGMITAIGAGLEGSTEEKLDAEGKTIFPGMVDIHVHFDEPGREEWEGFHTGSSMLAAGGCTTFFDMPLNGVPSTVTKRALLEKASIGKAESHVDFALWGGLVPGHLDDLADLADAGAIGFKAFLSPSGNPEFESVDDQTLLAGMEKIAELGGILALHSESAPIVTVLQQGKEARGLTGIDDYAASRPVQAEVEAVSRAILYSEITGCRLHFVHISSARAVDVIQAAKRRGLDVSLETCPHYLLYNHDDFRRLGAIAKCAPPLRPKEEQLGLVSRLIEGRIDIISSDHSPCEWKDKVNDNMFKVWGGISGGQFSLMSMIELALDHHVPLEKVAEWTAKAPAERFGLAGKGAIEIGKEADLAIVDLRDSQTVEKEALYQKNQFSLYVDHTFPCRITETVSRGRIVFSAGHLINNEVKGRWIAPAARPALHSEA